MRWYEKPAIHFANRVVVDCLALLRTDPLLKDIHQPVLIAVSGGSDSLAMLYQFAERFPNDQLSVATVDHQLRPEAADEALLVKEHVRRLGLDHVTLVWEDPQKTSSAMARNARYALLHDHALATGASVIALAHTLDDQAETLMMRAMRMKADSESRGLSGMREWSSYGKVKLWRPYLSYKRSDLRSYLTDRQIDWVDDPSNEELNFERIRVRQFLNRDQNGETTKDHIAKLAHLCARSRAWINQQCTCEILKSVRLEEDTSVRFNPQTSTPSPIIGNILVSLISVVGNRHYKPALSKLEDLTIALLEGKKISKAIGGCLVAVQPGEIHIKRENRNRGMELNRAEKPVRPGDKLSLPNHKITLAALEKFRPDTDDCIYEALKSVLVLPICST